MDRRVRDWANDKCVGQSIRSCQADGKLESGVTLRQIDTIRFTETNRDVSVCACVHARDTEKTNSRITTRMHRERGGRARNEDVRNGNRKSGRGEKNKSERGNERGASGRACRCAAGKECTDHNLKSVRVGSNILFLHPCVTHTFPFHLSLARIPLCNCALIFQCQSGLCP